VSGSHNLNTHWRGTRSKSSANIDLTVDPNGYRNPVLSTQLNLNAGSGGVVGGAGVIKVGTLNMLSGGTCCLVPRLGVYHQVGSLSVAYPTESGRNLDFPKRRQAGGQRHQRVGKARSALRWRVAICEIAWAGEL